jgi:hypothetical protein
LVFQNFESQTESEDRITVPENDNANELAKAGDSMKQPVIRIMLHTVKAHIAASVSNEKMRKEWTRG